MAKIVITGWTQAPQDVLLNTGQATVMINGVEYEYYGFTWSKFVVIERNNYRKPGRTLAWLKKNATECNKLKLVKSIRKRG